MAKDSEVKLRVPADKRTKDKCAIVGFTDHRAEAFKLPDDDWERWGINELYRVPGCEAAKFARWFEVHPRKDIDGDAPHIEALGKMDIPVYMQQHHADIPPSLAFPREPLVALSIQLFGRSYFTSSIAWQIAYAIHLGFKAIHVYGVDMAQDCLAPGTKVLTADLRWVRADEVNVGDDLMGFDEEPGDGTAAVHEEIAALEHGGTAVATERKLRAGRDWRVAKVLGRSAAMRPSYRINFEDGTSVVASAGHQWLTYGEHAMQWKRTDELVTPAHRPGRPTRVVRVLDTWEQDRSWEAGYLAAAFDGEGQAVAVTSIEFLGEVVTVGFTTSTATLIAEGFASHNSEYAEQRPCCEAWLAVAAGMGISIYTPPTSDLLKTVGEYGFGETGTEFGLKLIERLAWLHTQDNDWLAQLRGMDQQYPQIVERIEGERATKLQELQAQVDAVNGEHNAKRAGLEKEYREKREHLAAQRNQVYGAILDCNFWKRSWAVPVSASTTFSPDRTKDPRIGLGSPVDADGLGVSAGARALEEVAA